MTGLWQAFERLLCTDPRDVGCEQAITVLHVYVELLASGADPAEQFPGVVAHLAGCDSCAELARGILGAVQAQDPALHLVPRVSSYPTCGS